MIKQVKEFIHGRTGYANHNCRCDVCKAGMSAYQKQYRLDNLKMIHKKDIIRNALRSGYKKKHSRQYYLDNKQKYLKQAKEWAKNNRVRLNLAKKNMIKQGVWWIYLIGCLRG